jgi:hypothetical protein
VVQSLPAQANRATASGLLSCIATCPWTRFGERQHHPACQHMLLRSTPLTSLASTRVPGVRLPLPHSQRTRAQRPARGTTWPRVATPLAASVMCPPAWGYGCSVGPATGCYVDTRGVRLQPAMWPSVIGPAWHC